MPLPEDWRAFIESLNSNGVDNFRDRFFHPMPEAVK